MVLLSGHGRISRWAEQLQSGHASSKDAVSWNRDDLTAGIDVSADGWDSKMLAYPYAIEAQAGTYMFYNGNGFGATGFGYAKLERD